ncbi:MAG: sulfatase, partial [Phycisphaeraceae bacterium]
TTDHFRRDAVGRWTPNLMRLANRGTRFENAYCPSPLCGPARTAIVTGLLPSQNGVCGNMAEPIRDELRRDTFPAHLQNAGYRTSLVGKHHWIDAYGLKIDVTEQDDTIRGFGFDDVFQVLDEMESALFNDDELTHHLRREGRLEDYREKAKRHANAGGPFELPEADYADRFIADHAVRWLEQCGTGDAPWYLNVSFVGPHPPMWHPGECDVAPDDVPLPWLGIEPTAAMKQRRAHYMQKCILLDRYVGMILDQLETAGTLENTLVVFTSDHGDMLGDFGQWDKRFFREPSAGVPLIVAGPGIPRGDRDLGGQVRRDLVSTLDLYPTFLAAAGLDPASASSFRGRRFGIDLRALLADEPGVGHTAIYAELGTHAMCVDGRWKLVFDPEQGGVVQLFNRRNDPTEEHNLAGTPGYEHVTNAMLERIVSLRISLSQYTHEKERTRLQSVRRLIC